MLGVAVGQLSRVSEARAYMLSNAHPISIAPVDKNDEFAPERPAALARLAALQRLRDQMKAGNRQASLHALEKMIEQEAKALRHSTRSDAEPSS